MGHFQLLTLFPPGFKKQEMSSHIPRRLLQGRLLAKVLVTEEEQVKTTKTVHISHGCCYPLAPISPGQGILRVGVMVNIFVLVLGGTVSRESLMEEGASGLHWKGSTVEGSSEVGTKARSATTSPSPAS